MPGGPVDRTLLQSFYQDPGQTYDDKKTEGAIGVLADAHDSLSADYLAYKQGYNRIIDGGTFTNTTVANSYDGGTF